jgi:hypothetical protein
VVERIHLHPSQVRFSRQCAAVHVHEPTIVAIRPRLRV